MVRERALVVPPVLGQHPAGVVVHELVDQHPVEPGHAAELDGGPVAQSLERRCPLESGRRRLQLVQHQRGQRCRHRLLGRGLELDEHMRAARMGAHVQQLALCGVKLVDEAAAGAGLQQRPDPRAQRLAQQRGQRLALPRHEAEPALDVARGVAHAQRAAVCDQHHAMGLDGAGTVDRLLVAERQVGHGFAGVRSGMPERHPDQRTGGLNIVLQR